MQFQAMQDGLKISIPNPCHENWEQMTPDQQGRHCAVCDKVVRDFTKASDPEIIAASQEAAGTACGRFRLEQVAPRPLEGLPIVRVPVVRMRVFVLAFVLVFGLEAWGISMAQAQEVKPALDSLKKTEVLRSALQDSNDTIVLKGTVLDVYTREPVEVVSVSIWEGKRFVRGILTDGKGGFEFKVPKKDLHAETYELKVVHNGKERTDTGIRHDIRELTYLIDSGVLMDGMYIFADTERYVDVTHYLVGRYMLPIETRTQIYRPLDEWLMMNFSEIHHNGRW